MHYELIINEIEAVRSCLERMCNHQVLLFLVKLRKIINVLTGVNTIRNTETKIEMKSFQVLTSKEMSLNHLKVLDRFASNGELNSGSDIF